VFLLLAGAALATPAAELLAAGDLVGAWRVGQTAAELGELTAAAEAANLVAQYRAAGDTEKQLWLERAEKAARRAVRLFPESAEAYFQLAHAQAEIIRYVGVWGKITLASAIKDNLDACLSRDPDHARAYMGLALWNLQLAKRGLGWLYGASENRVVPLFERAVALAPENVEIRKNYGFALLEMGEPEKARGQLLQALALPARTVPDELHQQRARELLEGIGE
jgi:tetratricopeptide (TPR) repeat protein